MSKMASSVMVKNGWVYEQSMTTTANDLAKELYRINPNKYSFVCPENLRRKCSDTISKIKKMKKNKCQDLHEFLNLEFLPPKVKIPSSETQLKKENKVLKAKLESSENQKSNQKIQLAAMEESVTENSTRCEQIVSQYSQAVMDATLDREACTLKLEELELEHSNQTKQFDTCLQQIIKLNAKIPRKRAIDRKEKTVKRLKTTLRESQKALDEARADKEELLELLTDKLSLEDRWKREKVALQKRLSVLRKNLAKARQERDVAKEEATISLQEMEADLQCLSRRERESCSLLLTVWRRRR